MGFPRLIRQSEGLKKIPEPKDFGLDKVIDSIFSRSIGGFRDFVEQGFYLEPCDRRYDERDDGSRVLDFSRSVLLHPETDTEKIKSRQQILKAFIDNPELTELVLNSTIERSKSSYSSWSDELNNHLNRGEAYLNYIVGLAEKIPVTRNTELEAFRTYVKTIADEGEKIKKLRKALSDIEKPARLKLKLDFIAESGYFDETSINYRSNRADLTGRFASGEISESALWLERHGWADWKFSINLEEMCKAALESIKKKRKRDIVFWADKCKLDVDIDEETGNVSGLVTYKKLSLTKLLGDLIGRRKPGHKTVETEIDFGEDFNAGNFITASRYARYIKYNSLLRECDDDINRFAGSVIELRYLALAAEHFNKLKKQGYSLTFPEILEADERKFMARGLINPNLIGEVKKEEIVDNDTDTEDSSNLVLITGPNYDGKTNFTDAIGNGQAEGQAGLMMHAKKAAISVRDNIYSHYVRPGDLAAGHSRFSSELSRIRDIFKEATRNSMILIDEIGTGTDPKEGKEIAEGVFLTAGELGATTLTSTHFHELIDTAEQLPYARNLYCVTKPNGDGKSLVYTYKILPGSSRESSGLSLARKMGADREGLKELLNERKQREGLSTRID